MITARCVEHSCSSGVLSFHDTCSHTVYVLIEYKVSLNLNMICVDIYICDMLSYVFIYVCQYS